jgi:sRNA-binding carbon storage regulator CsrA
MLVLTRKLGQSIRIGGSIRTVKTDGSQVEAGKK